MADVLTINGIVAPTPAAEGLEIAKERIWSSNTGRSATGKMVGTVVATKTTIKAKFPPITLAQAKSIERAVADEFFPVVLKREEETVFSGTMYAGTPSYTVYSMAAGMPYAVNFSVDLIER